jgi:diguanylate cyclase (GGDEF)-like protein
MGNVGEGERVKPSLRVELLLGLVLPIAVLLGLAVLGRRTAEPAVCIAFMAAVPMLAAVVGRALIAGIVALATVVSAAVTAAAAYGQQFSDALPVLIGVIASAAIAVMASQVKAAAGAPRREPAPLVVRPATSPVAGPTDESDDLTGLPARAFVIRECAANDFGGTRVVALIGCDGMSAVNDSQGREVGDVCLFAVAGRTRWALPEEELVARWDGDEVLAVLIGDGATVEPTLRLISDKVNRNPIRTDAGLIPLTISVGAAEWAGGTSFDDAVARARRALHLAKSRGPGLLALDRSSSG